MSKETAKTRTKQSTGQMPSTLWGVVRYRNACAPALSGLEPIKRPDKWLERRGASVRKHL